MRLLTSHALRKDAALGMWLRVILAYLTLCRHLHGKRENSDDPANRQDCTLQARPGRLHSALLPSSTPARHPDSGEGGMDPLVTVITVAVLAVLCVGVLVIVVIVLVVRIRRWWRGRTSTRVTRRKKTVSNGVRVHLLSSTASTQNLECYRPRSLTPASPSSPSPPSPSPPPSLQPPSPSSHDYSEIPSNLDFSLHPSSHSLHLYEEIAKTELKREVVVVGECSDAEEDRTLYCHLEDATQSPSPPASLQQWYETEQDDPDSIRDNQQSSQDNSSQSQGSSLFTQDSCPNWILSPVTLADIQREEKRRRRVAPYRVSLILPLWEGPRDRGPLPRRPSLGCHVGSNSCNTLQMSGHYNHLQRLAGYDVLEEADMYATLEPFMRVEPMRPRSQSCDAQLYHHLRHF